MDGIYLLTLGVFILSIVVDGILINRRHPIVGYLAGLLPMIAYCTWLIIRAMTCESGNSVGCEWSGIGLLFSLVLTAVILLLYSFIAAGISRAHHSSYQRLPGCVPGWHSAVLAFQAIGLLLILSAAGGIAVKFYNDLEKTGMFVQWQSLGKPPDLNPLPGEKAVKIDSFDLYFIQIETNQGRLFKTDREICRSSTPQASSNCWYYGQKVKGQQRAPFNAPSEDDASCWIRFRVPEPLGHVLERVAASSCFPAYRRQTEYVLLDDGSVWTWRNMAYEETIFNLDLSPAFGALAGLCLGLFLTGHFIKPGTKQAENDPVDPSQPGGLPD